MKLALLMIIAVGLCVFGYFEARKKATGEEQVASITEVLNTTQQKLNTTESELAQAKRDLQDTTQRLAKLEESKKNEIAALQTKINEAAKQPTQTDTDEGKKQMTDLDKLRAKITAQETELSQDRRLHRSDRGCHHQSRAAAPAAAPSPATHRWGSGS